jgi:hypothetical protein
MANQREREESTSDKNLRIYGTRIPNVEDKRRHEAFMKAKDQAYMQSGGGAGGSEPVKDGLDEMGNPVSTMGMDRNEAFFAKSRAIDKKQLEGYKSYGDKSRGEAINAVRKLTGRSPIANTPKEFEGLVNKSLGFGTQSALNTPEGRQRAISSGVGAGLSAQDATARVQQAYDLLKEMSKTVNAPTVGQTPSIEQYGPPKQLAGASAVTGAGAPTTSKPTTPTTPAVNIEATPVEEGTVSTLAGAARGAALPSALAAKGALTLPSYVSGLQQTAATAPKLSTAQQGLAAAEKGVKNVMRLGGNKVPLAGSPYESALGKATGKVTQAAAEVSAAEKGLRAGAAAEKLAPVAKVAGKIAPVAKVLGKAAIPLAVGAELYDTGRFAFSPEQREKMTREVEASAEKGALRSELGGVISPMKTILGTGKLAGEALQSGSRARESVAAADTAQRLFDARLAARRADYSDEEFKALPTKEKASYMKDLRNRIKAQ